MTEVVTSSAAFLQPLLQAHKPQSSLISNPDSSQIELQIAAEGNRQNATAAAAEVPRASDDRASLNQDSGASRGSQNPPPRPRANDTAPHDQPAAPVGPSKARVDVPPLQLVQAPALQPKAPQPQAQAQAPAQQLQPQAAQSAPVQAAPAPPASTSDTPAPQPAQPVDVGALNNAEQLNTAALEVVSQNIVGVAFAPVQVSAQAPDEDPAGQQRQKNFIFSQRKLYVQNEQTGKFAADESRRVVRETTARETPKFAVEEAAQVVTSTVTAGKFAAETAQKVSEKAVPENRGAAVEAASGETRLYDKVPEAETQGRFGKDDDQTAEDRRASRESLYQRAAAIANALGERSTNPEVKKLVADVERYATQLRNGQGATATPVMSPSVVVTA